MKNKTIALRNLAVLAILTSFFIACDKDFATIESDIVNSDNATNFDTSSRDFDVIAYSKPLPAIQTNSLPVNLLGIYNDPIYGQTTSNIVSQLRPTLFDTDFGTDVALDSVVLSIPYFSTSIEANSNGGTNYELDSVFGDLNSTMKLSIYESNYFLRDFDPTSSINEAQVYYSNQTTGTSPIGDVQLEGTLLFNDDDFAPSASQIELKDEDGEITGYSAPALRVSFTDTQNINYWTKDLSYWYDKIVAKSGDPELSNTNNFNDYFRGLYFKVEDTNGSGTMSLLNLVSSNANITLYYTEDSSSEDSVQSTFVINFTGNRANFLSNDFVFPDGDENLGDEKLYLKGGEGSIAVVKLFDGEDIDDDIIFNSFESFKNEFVEMDENGKFVKSKKLINEANLVFYVDQDAVANLDEEPDRIYLYDMNNNTPLVDYYYDLANTVTPINSRTNHLGQLQREDTDTQKGIKYKIRLTEHINNLLLRDSTNVSLGLAVSGNVNLENNYSQFDVLNLEDSNDKVPVSSIITQRGTVLFGNNTLDEEKKLYLEIFYTEPNN